MFRFTIRDVLWLSALLAVSAGWLFDHAVGAWNRRISDAKLNLATGKLNELGWTVKSYPSGREFSVQRIYRPKSNP